ncbi:MAG: (d)CMP kinase [Bacteroidales bacterium]|nr:(d)CMP kinase [Bacteroidales bacterium]
MKTPDIIIAIDGYSSTGKSSFAKLVAAKLGYLYLDSGALYRGVTLFAIENGMIDSDCRIDEEKLENALSGLDLHFENHDGASLLYTGGRCIEKEIRGMEVSGKVSPIAALAFVRNYVDNYLRAAGSSKRVVMDGRDIGTTVFPQAELKIFMTADPLVRAQRRANELKAKGEEADVQEVLKNLQERDYIDSHREVSPLTQAPDAVVLDNSHMTFDDQMDWILALIEEKF